MNANNCIIVGRLARAPELNMGFKTSAGEQGYRCFMRIAVTRMSDLAKPRKEQRANFVPVVCWGKLAKNSAEYLDVGTEVTVIGEFMADSRPKLNGAGEHIVVEGKKQYHPESLHLNASSIQFGQRSLKNKNGGTEVGADVSTETPAGEPAAAEAPTPAAAGANGDNPFGEADAATA